MWRHWSCLCLCQNRPAGDPRRSYGRHFSLEHYVGYPCSTDSACLLVEIETKLFVADVRFSGGNIIMVVFLRLWPTFSGPGRQPNEPLFGPIFNSRTPQKNLIIHRFNVETPFTFFVTTWRLSQKMKDTTFLRRSSIVFDAQSKIIWNFVN